MTREAIIEFNRHSLLGFAKQIHLSCLVAGRNWRFEVATGLLTFSGQRSWQTQFVGIEADADGARVWAWANNTSNIPDQLLRASHAMRAYGEKHAILELTEPVIPLSDIDGQTLALISSGICKADAYYFCAFEGGSLLVLIEDEQFPRCLVPPLPRIATVFPRAIASLDIPDHRLALIGYLDSQGLSYEPEGDKILVREGGETLLMAAFDNRNRLTKLDVMLRRDP